MSTTFASVPEDTRFARVSCSAAGVLVALLVLSSPVEARSEAANRGNVAGFLTTLEEVLVGDRGGEERAAKGPGTRPPPKKPRVATGKGGTRKPTALGGQRARPIKAKAGGIAKKAGAAGKRLVNKARAVARGGAAAGKKMLRMKASKNQRAGGTGRKRPVTVTPNVKKAFGKVNAQRIGSGGNGGRQGGTSHASLKGKKLGGTSFQRKSNGSTVATRADVGRNKNLIRPIFANVAGGHGTTPGGGGGGSGPPTKGRNHRITKDLVSPNPGI